VWIGVEVFRGLGQSLPERPTYSFVVASFATTDNRRAISSGWYARLLEVVDRSIR
jgi:hypothetical protein